jgi:succinate dehydrogenase / fumarate reductase cytochrome b subunit
LLACGIPLSAGGLGLSLQSPQAYARLLQLLIDQWPSRLMAILFVWALAHHVLAGIRHLLGDIDVGSTLPAARRSAWTVNIVGVAVALLGAGALF